MGDEAKLPRWARNELSRLRADLAYTQQQMAELMGPAGQESTDTRHGPHGAELHPLPAQSLIRFTLPVPANARAQNDDYLIEATTYDCANGVHIRSAHRLLIVPVSSNTLVLRDGTTD